MTELAKYPYRPLRYEDSIRLIQLHPCDDDDAPIKFFLLSARLSETSWGYEALSYTWGAEYPKQAIFCQSPQSVLEVTQNCYSALKRLRNDTVRCLWIDAICINQEDMNEKSVQVRMMDRVFATASRVIVDLGEATSGSCLLFEELAEAEQSRTTNGKYTRQAPDKKIIRELEHLCQRPWFSRVWVVQEVVANSCVQLMCGSQKGSWEALNACKMGYRQTFVSVKADPPVLRLRAGNDPELNLFESLWEPLLRTRSLSATDPRDRVFALLSLLQSSLNIRRQLIDYAQTCEAIFTRVALLLLQQVGLEYLISMRHGHTRAMSSWIADWSQNYYNINYVGELEDWGSSEFEVLLKEPDCHRSEGCKQAEHVHVKAADLKRSNLLGILPFGQQRFTLKVKAVQVGAITHQGGVFSFRDHDDAHQAFLDIIEFFRSIDPQQNFSGHPGNMYLSSDILYAFRPQWPSKEEFLSLITRDLYGLSLLESAKEDIDPRLHLDGKYYFRTENDNTFLRAMQECRIFVAGNGSIGIAPEKAQSGDSICIVQGASAPCIVRPIADNQWLLISGDCFLWRHPIPHVQDWQTGDIDKEDLWNSWLREGVEEDLFLC